MAKGDYLSSSQQKIVKRYYQNIDTLALQKLSEFVSELFLAAGDPKKEEKLWAQVTTYLPKIGADETHVRRILAQKDLQALAKLVNEAAGGGAARPKTK
jgi:hypothetical protein